MSKNKKSKKTDDAMEIIEFEDFMNSSILKDSVVSNIKNEVISSDTKSKRKSKKESEEKDKILQQTIMYEKRIYDLEQLLDIAKSFCENLDLSNLLESIVYICMAQMHVLGAEIFVRDFMTNKDLVLETSKELCINGIKMSISASSPIVSKLLELNRPVTFSELSSMVEDSKSLGLLEVLAPTLIVPLIQKSHLNGLLLLQERIVIDDNTAYDEYEKNQIMAIASLASVAINNAALVEMSSTDMMTHLKLKFYFFKVLSEAIDNAIVSNSHISVLMFDIDFFKKFNDTYGHECGDYVLIQVASLLKTSLRDTDVASRYGGEEFTVLLNNTGKEEALLVAERIRTTIENNDFVYNDQHLHVTVSGGVAVFDVETNKVEVPNEFVNQADQGLYMSKSNGRNKITYFDPKKNK